jgi:tripartite-type tricarboxylate transporter receptor subunit TctC
MNEPNGGAGIKRRRMALGLGMAASALVLPRPLAAQHFPTRPIRLVVSFPPGGSTDIYARILAAKLSERLGQNVVVDNRPGGGGAIAAAAVIRAEPDGHTLMYTTSSLTILPNLMPTPGFDVRRDLRPVVMIFEAPQLVVAARELVPLSIAELITAAKAAPGRINVAHAGSGSTSHLVAAKFIATAGIDAVLVPYAGTAGALSALLRNEAAVAFDAVNTGGAFTREGKLRAMAVTTARRAPVMPEVPTIAESGLPGFEAVFWNGIFAPVGTPAEVVTQLNLACQEVLRQPDVVERVREMGTDPAGGPPEVLARRFEADSEGWGRVIRDMKLRSD